MADKITDWTFDEFKAYLLLEAAHADMEFSKAEDNFIHKRVGNQVFEKIYSEFSDDSDYQRITKLQDAAKTHCTTEKCKTILKEDLMKLFKADQNVDLMEKNMLLFLNRVIGK